MDNSSFDDIFGTPSGDNSGDSREPRVGGTPKVFSTKSKIIISVVVVIALVGIFVAGLLVGQNMYKGISVDQPLMDEVYDIVKKHYIYDVVDDEEIRRLMAAGMVSGLDKYTGIYLKNRITGPKYGVSYETDDYNLKIVKNVDEGSSMYGKVMRGDIIQSIYTDTQEKWMDVRHYNIDKFVAMVNESDTMRMKIEREGTVIETETFTKTYNLHDSLAEYRDTDYTGIGYVRLKSFDEGAAEAFMSAIYDFEQSGNNVMVLDIRDNPGGSTLELAAIVNNFIENSTKKDIVIKIENRNDGTSYTYAEQNEYADLGASGNGTTTNRFIGKKLSKPFRLVIVANDDSASASEAFIGNIKHYMDRDHYLLLGESKRTFGKGIAQRDYYLKSDPNLALHMTIGKYYVLGEKGSAKENDYTNIHGKGYALDNTDIKRERKADILSEDAIIKACERAKVAFGDVLA